jgi:hypothetical protein
MDWIFPTGEDVGETQGQLKPANRLTGEAGAFLRQVWLSHAIELIPSNNCCHRNEQPLFSRAEGYEYQSSYLSGLVSDRNDHSRTAATAATAAGGR